MKSLFWQADSLRLHAVDHGGGGRPVVLLHGVTGHARVWDAVAPALAGAGRVIAVDLRGHGESQWSAEGRYTTADHTADLLALLDLLDTPVDLVGLSWGGLVAVHTAALQPQRVRRLAVLDVPLSFTQGEDQVPRRPGAFGSHREVWRWERDANRFAPEPMIDTLAWHGVRPGPGGRLERRHDPYFLTRWPFRRDDRGREFAALTTPALLVHGAESPVLDADTAERTAGLRAGVRLVHLKRCGHLVPVDAPDQLALVLQEFL
ncbi:alpha/beta fold hydrolase [Streptomyces sp. NPDC058045]|uniref:alpha/beta fold hydrolase n=1 Tax=Streptomyces sp. NPDC058045 TaxID=3346311 RepID=UPI0036E4196D